MPCCVKYKNSGGNVKIRDDHMYHGSALIQIAEHSSFTAINSLKIGRRVISMAYMINDDAAVYLKYASKPNKTLGEYQFTFLVDHLKDLSDIAKRHDKVFVVLVCVADREICYIEYSQLAAMIAARKAAKGSDEEQYTVLVTAPKGKGLRIYMNAPGKKNTTLGSTIVSRNGFPDVIFA